MFGDTIDIDYNAVTKTLNKINQDGYSSEYLLKDGSTEFRVNIRHSSYLDRKRLKTVERHNMELVYTSFGGAADGSDIIRRQYSVLEVDRGDTVATGVVFSDSFVGLLAETGTAEALLGWQS